MQWQESTLWQWQEMACYEEKQSTVNTQTVYYTVSILNVNNNRHLYYATFNTRILNLN